MTALKIAAREVLQLWRREAIVAQGHAGTVVETELAFAELEAALECEGYGERRGVEETACG